jgi:hypothetical protein
MSGICENQLYKPHMLPMFANALPAGFLIVTPRHRSECRSQFNLHVPDKIRWCRDNHMHEPPNPLLRKVRLVVPFGWFATSPNFENDHTNKKTSTS